MNKKIVVYRKESVYIPAPVPENNGIIWSDKGTPAIARGHEVFLAVRLVGRLWPMALP